MISTLPENLQIVWLKRDLRLSDHQPMQRAIEEAASYGPVILVYVHEPAMINRSDFSAAHSGFIRETLTELSLSANAIGAQLLEGVGEPCEIFSEIHHQIPVSRILVHQESGHIESYERDKRVSAWCKTNKVLWLEHRQNNVFRGSAFKQGFDFHDYLNQSSSISLWHAKPSPSWAKVVTLNGSPIPTGIGVDKAKRLKGGRSHADKLLFNFCNMNKLCAYPFSISAPMKAIKSCSLLSAALSYGILSDREVIQALNAVVVQHKNHLPLSRRKNLHDGALAYAQRLGWRSAYLQCFEQRVDTETKPNIPKDDSPSVESSKLEESSPEFIAWSTGHTGVPMVDAAMRMLCRLGWINMRMRGMLATFGVGTLGIDWRVVGLHLAREFVDYEPAIHWNQMQIHAGISSLSPPLSYNPIKQAKDQDPDGSFIKTWVPELANVPLQYLPEPWCLDASQQKEYQCVLGVNYTLPIVDMSQAAKKTRDRLFKARKN